MSYPWIQSHLLVTTGFSLHGFTMRGGAGVSQGDFATWNFSPSTGDDPATVEQNFRILADYLPVEREAIRSVHQVHSDRVVVLEDRTTPTVHEKADGLLSWVSGVVVAVKTADCVPVLIADPSSQAVAAVHAGWRGVVSEIVGKTVDAIFARSPQAQPVVAIGPHICANCFQVGPEVAAEFPEHHRDDPSTPGRFLVDMAGALQAQLTQRGILLEHIDITGHCTLCDPQQRFFSHRGHHGKCGRMLNFIGRL